MKEEYESAKLEGQQQQQLAQEQQQHHIGGDTPQQDLPHFTVRHREDIHLWKPEGVL